MKNPIMRFFAFHHLPDGPMKETSALVCGTANWMNDNLPDGPEKSAGLRKLLEAKDCFVRAAMPESKE